MAEPATTINALLPLRQMWEGDYAAGSPMMGVARKGAMLRDNALSSGDPAALQRQREFYRDLEAARGGRVRPSFQDFMMSGSFAPLAQSFLQYQSESERNRAARRAFNKQLELATRQARFERGSARRGEAAAERRFAEQMGLSRTQLEAAQAANRIAQQQAASTLAHQQRMEQMRNRYQQGMLERTPIPLSPQEQLSQDIMRMAIQGALGQHFAPERNLLEAYAESPAATPELLNTLREIEQQPQARPQLDLNQLFSQLGGGGSPAETQIQETFPELFAPQERRAPLGAPGEINFPTRAGAALDPTERFIKMREYGGGPGLTGWWGRQEPGFRWSTGLARSPLGLPARLLFGQ